MFIEFCKFQTACRYASLAYDDPDDHTQLSIVCKKKRTPGESWGKCDEAHCPYFGVEIHNIQIFQNGELVATAESGTIVYE